MAQYLVEWSIWRPLSKKIQNAYTAIAAISATKGIKNKNERTTIIDKIIKQLFSAGKTKNLEAFKIYAKYSHGGVPEKLSTNKLMEIMVETQKTTPIRHMYKTNRNKNIKRQAVASTLKAGASNNKHCI